MSERVYDDRIERGQTVTGQAAIEQAEAWNLKRYDGAEFVEARRSGHIGCRWAYDGAGFGQCATCGDMTFPDPEDDEGTVS